ncbi:MAG TPA: hypothetical protein VFA84_07420 [Acidimicrobiales bacterium]|nr:hypothetical protein [Acidimicrobiales bacterium]
MDPTAIDVERVTAVLLIDGWHYIQQRSFRVEPYAFTAGESVVAKPQAGYFFDKIDQISRELQHFCGPIDCVMAVRYEVLTELATYDAEDSTDDEDDDD